MRGGVRSRIASSCSVSVAWCAEFEVLGVSRVVVCRLVVRHPAARSQLIICQSRPAAARRQSRGVRSRAASPCTMSVSSCARRQSRRAEWPRREESCVVASCVIASRVVSSNCIDAAFRTIIDCFFPFLRFPPSHVVLPSVLFFSYCTDASFRAVYCQHASVRIVALEVRFFYFKVRHSLILTSSKFSITRQGLFQKSRQN